MPRVRKKEKDLTRSSRAPLKPTPTPSPAAKPMRCARCRGCEALRRDSELTPLLLQASAVWAQLQSPQVEQARVLRTSLAAKAGGGAAGAAAEAAAAAAAGAAAAGAEARPSVAAQLAAVAEDKSAASVPPFVACEVFEGKQQGYSFKTAEQGTGAYWTYR